jgi:hypothetical protein
LPGERPGATPSGDGAAVGYQSFTSDSRPTAGAFSEILRSKKEELDLFPLGILSIPGREDGEAASVGDGPQVRRAGPG